MLKKILINGFSVEVYSTREEMGQAAARVAKDRINKVIEEKGIANVVFAAAPSQNDTLKYLVKEDVDWSKVRAFHMDEYIGLPENSPNLFARYLDDHIFRLVKFKEVYYVGTDYEKSQARYTELIEEFPPDVVCLGIGENGHIAFNDPHVADFNDKLKIKRVALDLKCRNQQVHDKTFSTLEEVPKYALTLTIPVLFGAEHLICTVPTKEKAWAVDKMINDEINEKVPCTILRRHKDACVFVDESAFSLAEREII